VRHDQAKHLTSLARSILTPPSRVPVSEWSEQNLYIPPPQTQRPGRLSWMGCEYLREPLDGWNTPGVTDLVLCFGSQTGKTTMLQAGVSWVACESPSGILWVLPNKDLAGSFSKTRWQPIIEASPLLAERKPRNRHDYTTASQKLGGSIVTLIGSNSPSNLSSRPARVVVLDEVDKFPVSTRGEADAVNLAEQRTKSYSNPLRVKCSTPVMEDGLIWQEFLKGDMRRYYVPCPACGKHVLFAWSAEFTLLPKTGAEAWVKWDQNARTKDGWDLDRVRSTAYALCPWCSYAILDSEKSRMIRRGEWRPTGPAASGFRSYHLPSMYGTGVQTSFGNLAVKFLQAKRSLLGLQGFINGDLAEPFASQDTRSQRIELIVTPGPAPAGGVSMMTVDCQAVSPLFWYVIRSWVAPGNSRLVRAGHCDQWEDLRQVQQELGVEDNHVGIDSGHAAAEVYDNCLRFGKIVGVANRLHVGWSPMKGREKEAQWKDDKGRPKPYFISSASLSHRHFRLPLLEFNADYMLDVLATLRNPNNNAGLKWEVTEDAGDEYWRHLDSKIRKQFSSGRTGKTVHIWAKRSERWPDHLLDCEVMQLPLATLHRLLSMQPAAGYPAQVDGRPAWRK
jgi:hypothetical protein